MTPLVLFLLSAFAIDALDILEQFGQTYGLNIAELRRVAPSTQLLHNNDGHLQQYLDDSTFLMPEEIEHIFDAFIEYKREYGSNTERKYYQDKTGRFLIKKCITQRAIEFAGKRDITILRGTHGFSFYPPWHLIGKDKFERANDIKKRALITDFLKLAPQSKVTDWKMDENHIPQYIQFLVDNFNIEQYLSYDEMQLSALLMVAGPTKFYNDGNRFNKGVISDSGVAGDGYIVGGVGSRFEKPGFMDDLLYIKGKQHKDKMARIIFGDELYEENTKEDSIKMWGPKKDKPIFVDLLSLRYRMTYKAYLAYIVYQMKQRPSQQNETERKKAYVSVTGIGAGVWAIDNIEQQKFIVLVVKNIMDDFINHSIDLKEYIDTIDFTYFAEGSGAPFGTNDNAPIILGNMKKENGTFLYHGVNIVFSINNPSSDKGSNNIAIELYAWDGNSLPGNEVFLTCSPNNPQIGMNGKKRKNKVWLAASGDPAAAVSSDIMITQNPLINLNLGKSIRIYRVMDGDVKILHIPLPAPTPPTGRRLMSDNTSGYTIFPVYGTFVIMFLTLLASVFIYSFYFNNTN